MGGTDAQAHWLRTACDYSEGAVVQVLTIRSRICFSRAQVPAQSALWMCHSWRQLGGAIARSKAGHLMCYSWGPLGGAPLQAKFSCSPCSAGSHLASATRQSTGGCQLHWAWRCLERLSCELRLAAASARLAAAQQVVRDMLKPDSACLGFENP